MPTTTVFVAIILQLGFYIWLTIHFVRSFIPHKRVENRFQNIHVFVEFLILTLLAVCFILYRLSSFSNEPHFFEFTIITGITLVFYFLSKIEFKSAPYSREINLSFVATLFWLSFFTAIKFIPYLLYIWIPFFGLLAFAPVLMAILCLTEIRYRNINHSLNTMQILLFGLIPIIALQLYMNTYTETWWAFVELFNPPSTNLY